MKSKEKSYQYVSHSNYFNSTPSKIYKSKRAFLKDVIEALSQLRPQYGARLTIYVNGKFHSTKWRL